MMTECKALRQPVKDVVAAPRFDGCNPDRHTAMGIILMLASTLLRDPPAHILGTPRGHAR